MNILLLIYYYLMSNSAIYVVSILIVSLKYWKKKSYTQVTKFRWSKSNTVYLENKTTQ